MVNWTRILQYFRFRGNRRGNRNANVHVLQIRPEDHVSHRVILDHERGTDDVSTDIEIARAVEILHEGLQLVSDNDSQTNQLASQNLLEQQVSHQLIPSHEITMNNGSRDKIIDKSLEILHDGVRIISEATVSERSKLEIAQEEYFKAIEPLFHIDEIINSSRTRTPRPVSENLQNRAPVQNMAMRLNIQVQLAEGERSSEREEVEEMRKTPTSCSITQQEIPQTPKTPRVYRIKRSRSPPKDRNGILNVIPEGDEDIENRPKGVRRSSILPHRDIIIKPGKCDFLTPPSSVSRRSSSSPQCSPDSSDSRSPRHLNASTDKTVFAKRSPYPLHDHKKGSFGVPTGFPGSVPMTPISESEKELVDAISKAREELEPAFPPILTRAEEILSDSNQPNQPNQPNETVERERVQTSRPAPFPVDSPEEEHSSRIVTPRYNQVKIFRPISQVLNSTSTSSRSSLESMGIPPIESAIMWVKIRAKSDQLEALHDEATFSRMKCLWKGVHFFKKAAIKMTLSEIEVATKMHLSNRKLWLLLSSDLLLNRDDYKNLAKHEKALLKFRVQHQDDCRPLSKHAIMQHATRQLNQNLENGQVLLASAWFFFMAEYHSVFELDIKFLMSVEEQPDYEAIQFCVLCGLKSVPRLGF